MCRRCGVYVAMVLVDGVEAWSTVNVDALDERTFFKGEARLQDFSADDEAQRIARRKA